MVHDHKAIDHDLVPANPDGRCDACGGSITAGNYKVLLTDGNSLHEYCAPAQLPRELAPPAPAGDIEARCYRQFNTLYEAFFAQQGSNNAQRQTARAIDDAHRYWEMVLGIERAYEIKQRARYLAEPGVLVQVVQ